MVWVSEKTNGLNSWAIDGQLMRESNISPPERKKGEIIGGGGGQKDLRSAYLRVFVSVGGLFRDPTKIVSYSTAKAQLTMFECP